MSYANNKGADQPAHPRSLISAFVVRCYDSIISLDSIADISTLPSFCGCTGRFVSGLVGNSRRHVLSCRGSFVFLSRLVSWAGCGIRLYRFLIIAFLFTLYFFVLICNFAILTFGTSYARLNNIFQDYDCDCISISKLHFHSQHI